MCVICHAAKKRHMRREEVIEACRVNSAGFFGFTLENSEKGAVRRTVRTLDEKEFLEFFDSVKEDSPFVMHARIPSYGPKSLENVHGWEEDGILFMHNMSLHDLDGFRSKFPDWKTKTDSEFFFRKLFIPYYRGLGDDAYKDGRMHEDLYRFVDWVCGTGNRFLFIMPDNRVIRFGSWVKEDSRKEDGECAFYASNSSYRVFGTSGSGKGGVAVRKTAGFSASDYDDPDYDEYAAWERYGTYGTGEPVRREPEGKIIRDVAGDAQVVKIALEHMVLHNAANVRAMSEDIEAPKDSEEMLDTYLESVVGPILDADMVKIVEDGIDTTASCTDIVEGICVPYAAALEKSILENGARPGYYSGRLSKFDAETYLKDVERKMRVAARMLDVAFDWDAEDVENFATAYDMGHTRTGKPSMERIKPADLIVPVTMTVEDAEDAVRDLIVFASMTQKEIDALVEHEGREADGAVAKAEAAEASGKEAG